MSNNSNNSYMHIQIVGVVQSVGFRPFIKNLADKLHQRGYVRNLANAGVEIILLGDYDNAKSFFDEINKYKPELSLILSYSINPIEFSEIILHEVSKFSILNSDVKLSNSIGISPLPPDISICIPCQNDLDFGRRENYSFVSCTNCGPRYTVIKQIPYDRINTSFNEFPLCTDCDGEYKQSTNRRFHAQTTCCSTCGPKYTYFRWKNEWILEKLNWKDIGLKMKIGDVFGIMSTGGTHLVTDAHNITSVLKLRQKRRNKSKKPFALMMRNISTIKKYCILSSNDIELLLSVRKPIVIVQSRDPELWYHISPGLHTLGVMLPYNSLHHLLFKHSDIDVYLMTSANLPGIPMPITPIEVKSQLVGIADDILVHNRKIIQRVDDSVIRSHGNGYRIIRRSRGFVPQPFYMSDLKSLSALAFGAEENNTASLLKNGWIITTQHLGHSINIESLEFMKNAVGHLKHLFHINPDYYLSDLHPDFQTTLMAHNQSNNEFYYGIQHHVSHIASLGVDNNLSHNEPILAWACDGFGLSPDNNAWGSELLLLENGNWNRMASTTPIDFDGGDRNTIYPTRMLLKYLIASEIEINNHMAFKIMNNLADKNTEYDYLMNKKKTSITTSSIARLFDSISALLDISHYRSYRGEPAIKLEDMALQSTQSFIVDTGEFIMNNKIPVIDTVKIFSSIYSKYEKGMKKKDIARYTHDIIGQSLATVGSDIAAHLEMNHLGFTGGIAYNYLINHNLSKFISDDLRLLTHTNIPPGDAGISVGQLNYFGMMKNHNLI